MAGVVIAVATTITATVRTAATVILAQARTCITSPKSHRLRLAVAFYGYRLSPV